VESVTPALGKLLGLDIDFVVEVVRRGQDAVIDRAESVDRTGAHGLVLGMVQQLGMLVQQSAEEGQGVQDGQIAEASALICQGFGVPEDIGLYILGSVWETFQHAVGQLNHNAIRQEIESDEGRPIR